MDKKYVLIGKDDFISKPMNKKEAINKSKEYDKEGRSVYIISEEEAKRVKKKGKFNTPKWS